MKLRPKLVPSLAVLVGVLITSGLSAWQVKRHQYRNEGGTRAGEVAHLDPVGNAALAGPLDDVYWRRVELTGRYVDAPILVSSRSDRERAGYGLLEPFQLDGGPVVVVDRGFVKGDGLEAVLPTLDTGDALVTVYGQLRPLRGDVMAKVTDKTIAGVPVWSKNAHMNFRDLTYGDRALDAFVVSGKALADREKAAYNATLIDGYIPVPWDDTSRNYAFQWAGFAVILVVLWLRGSVETS